MIPVDQYFPTFEACINHYHLKDTVDQNFENPHPKGSFEALIYHKCWIDTVQWHFEDLIREPSINPQDGMELKRKIDASNQRRTDMVEQIDDQFLQQFKDVAPTAGAKLNTESPAWVVDRLSILALKIYHMQEQADRTGVDVAHTEKSKARLQVLLEQKQDLTTAFAQLLSEYKLGTKTMKVYRQMKLYNDPATNPALYGAIKS